MESGGAGTIYISQQNYSDGFQRELIVGNDGQKSEVEFLSLSGTDSGKTVANLGVGDMFELEKLKIEKSSDLLFKPSSSGSHIVIGQLSGDRTGMLHITEGTSIDIRDASGSFGAAFRAYPGSDLSLPEGLY